jgi:hypothetical protein
MDTYLALAAVIALFVVLAAPSLVGLAREHRIDRQLRAARAAEAARQQWGMVA